MTEETVTITKQEYARLVKDAQWLDCLEMADVDGWDGIEEAMRIRREMQVEDRE